MTVRVVSLASRWLLSFELAVVLLLGTGPPSEAQAATPPTDSVARIPALTAFGATWATIASYTATITVFEQLGTRTDRAVFAYTFHKPAPVTLRVDAGPNVGATVVWNGGSSVTVSKGRGLLALLKKTVPLHDPLVTTLRGDSVDQVSFGSILAHGESIVGSLRESVGPQIRGVATSIVTLLPATPATDGGLTREVLYISNSTNLPVQILGYEGATLVRNIAFTDVKLTSAK